MAHLLMGENADRVTRAFARWNAGDRGVPYDEIDPEAEVHTVIGEAFEGQPFRGHEGVESWLAGLDDNFELWQIVIDDLHEDGDTVVALGQIHARGRGSGLELDQDVGWVIRFRDGRFWRFRTFFTHEEALAAGGIS